jgi:hypothetical protein
VRRFAIATGAAGLLATGFGVGPALGAALVPDVARPTPFTIHETVVLASQNDSTFTAEGPLCASGTFHDDFSHATAYKGAAGKFTLMGTTVYTCGDGSGTFFARKKVFITYNEDGSFTNRGPIELTGGTGDYAGLRGNGTDDGVGPLNPATGTVDIGTGTITGTIVP